MMHRYKNDLLEKIRIVTVSYYNTLPFVYGIKNSGILKNYILNLKTPAECAKTFAQQEADIALVPVGSLVSLTNYKIITSFCLSAYNEVKTVLLLSNKKLETISCIGLDSESETSVRLIKILARYFWKINPEFKEKTIRNIEDLDNCDALVVIGDKTFEISKQFTYKTDLASEWKSFTGMPLVFALWICREDLNEKIIQQFQSALEFGVNNISNAISVFSKNKKLYTELEYYLNKNIDYLFDDLKRNSVNEFLYYVKNMDK